MLKNELDSGWYTEHHLKKMGFLQVGNNVRIAKNCTIVGVDKIILKSNIRIDSYCTIVTVDNLIEIGNYVHIAPSVHISGGGGVTFEDFSFASASSNIYSTTDSYLGPSFINPTVPLEYRDPISEPVIFKKLSGLGSNSVVLPGVTLHEGAVTGINTSVTKSLDPWGIYVGSPAKKLKDRERIDEKIFNILMEKIE